ncbi:MAG: hypothetical protein K9J77_08780 [Rhodoferax sp.]|nr:hypothetical protein [Rhodoferax sp.]
MVSTQIYGHVDAQNYPQAHWLVGCMLAFSLLPRVSGRLEVDLTAPAQGIAVVFGSSGSGKTSLLLDDEPLAALDPARRQEILPWLERLRGAQQIPMLYGVRFKVMWQVGFVPSPQRGEGWGEGLPQVPDFFQSCKTCTPHPNPLSAGAREQESTSL